MEFFENLWDTVVNTVLANWHNVLKFLLVLVIGAFAVKIAVSIIRKLLNSPKSNLKGTAANFLTALAKTALICLYVIVLLSTLGVDTTSLVAIFSVLTLAISLAVQGVISNLASGIMLVVTKPFEEGNFVDIDGVSGIVEHIGITCTKMRTGDNKVIIIPNANITSNTITNYSTKPTSRLDLTFGVSYDSDVQKVKEILLGVIAKHEEILKDPAPFVRLTNHGDSSLDFVVRVWVKQSDYWAVNFDLKEEVLAAFNEANISIPYPQMDVHVVQ